MTFVMRFYSSEGKSQQVSDAFFSSRKSNNYLCDLGGWRRAAHMSFTCFRCMNIRRSACYDLYHPFCFVLLLHCLAMIPKGGTWFPRCIYSNREGITACSAGTERLHRYLMDQAHFPAGMCYTGHRCLLVPRPVECSNNEILISNPQLPFHLARGSSGSAIWYTTSESEPVICQEPGSTILHNA